jgi:hypothetical protein
MAGLVAGGGVDRGGAGPGREVGFGRKPGDVTDLDEQTRSAGGANTVEVGQGGAGGGEQLVEFLVRCLLAGIDPLKITDQFRGYRRRVLPATSRGRTVASNTFACAADRSFFAPPGISSNNSW